MSSWCLHPEQEVTATRPSVGGDPRDHPPTDLGTFTAGVENVRSKIRMQPGGEDVQIALRLWIADMTTFRPGDVFSVDYLDQIEQLVVEDPKRYPLAQPPHQQVLVVSRLGSDEAGTP